MFVTQGIRDLLAGISPRWFKFSDGGRIPVSGTIPIDPDTGFLDRKHEYPELISWLPVVGEYSSILNTGASINFNDGNSVYNPDGSCRSIGLAITGSTTRTAGATITVRVFGRTVGVRWRRYASGPAPVFDLVIDGVSYRCSDGVNRGSEASYNAEFIVRDLDEINHDVSLVVPDSGATGTDYFFMLFGFLVEGASWQKRLRGATVSTPTEVPQTSTAISYQTASAVWPMSAVRKIIYYNPSGSDVTVTIYRGTVAMAAILVQTGKTAEFDFGEPVVFDNVTPFKHIASAASVIYTTIGRI